jgi:glycosyltransferase involved in cell wall biosynthesis
MKVLFVSNLFPDEKNPNFGSYNAQLLHHLSRLCEIRVLAPRPTKGFPPFWLPKRFDYREADGCFQPIFAPAAYLPKIGSRFNHLLMARTIEPALRGIREKFSFDVVLSSWIYPDVCAVAQLARRNKIPFVAIAQGSDVHQYLKIPARRKIISDSLSYASAVVARSKDLAQQLSEAGVTGEKLHVIYNGVDFQKFFPAKQSTARKTLGLSSDATILLFVGNLLPIKNPLLVVEAHGMLCRNHPDKNFVLVMIGTGPLEKDIRNRSHDLGTTESVFLAGTKSSDEVARYMQAADLLCVPSNNEGVPNVILEAFASGLRVIARNVGGIPEILCQDFLGRSVMQPDPPAIAEAILKALAGQSQPEQIAEYARRFSWESTARHYFELLQQAKIHYQLPNKIARDTTSS